MPVFPTAQSMAELGLMRGQGWGLELSNNGTDADHDIDIAAGAVGPLGYDAWLVNSSTLVKQIDAAWAVGTNAGGLDTGTVANSTWYHVHMIRRSDTGVVDALFSTSATSPTMPTNYDQRQRIGSVLTDGSANIIPFAQTENRVKWSTGVLDINSTNPGTSAVTAALTVPPAVSVCAFGSHGFSCTASTGNPAGVLFSSLAVSDVSPTATNNTMINYDTVTAVLNAMAPFLVDTNTSRQIRTRVQVSTADTTLYGLTHGWYDPRWHG